MTPTNGTPHEPPTDGEPRYRRVVVKVSGASLGSHNQPLDLERMTDTAKSIAAIHRMNISVVVVVGGGNLFRGTQGSAWQLDQPQADEVGMLATGINVLLLNGILTSMDIPTQVFSNGPCAGIGSIYRREDVREALYERRQVALVAGGAGVPGISTDSPAVQMAIDTKAEAIIMAKHGVDGVYDADPRRHPGAHFIATITASEALVRNLKIMDATALALARDHGKAIHVIPANEMHNLRYVVEGKELGSTVLPQ